MIDKVKKYFIPTVASAILVSSLYTNYQLQSKVKEVENNLNRSLKILNYHDKKMHDHLKLFDLERDIRETTTEYALNNGNQIGKIFRNVDEYYKSSKQIRISHNDRITNLETITKGLVSQLNVNKEIGDYKNYNSNVMD